MLFFIALLCLCNVAYSYYIYPVASLEQDDIIFFIKQSSLDHIDLIMWDNKTQRFENCLWSIYNPASVQLLPDKRGFSFIDKGRLRIKYFNKRSPKTIDFDHYFYNLHHVQWINNEECYFSAKELDHISIYCGHVDGRIRCLATHDTADCTYPQKVANQLFYIKRTDQKDNYSIIQTPSPSSAQHKDFSVIINFDAQPIIFLKMLSLSEGFVISHAPTIDVSHDTIDFSYYKISKNKKSWSKKKLFSFSIPSYLLRSKNKISLYESLLPLIPRLHESTIYFVDSSYCIDNRLELFTYDLKTCERKKKLSKWAHHQHLFVPLVHNLKIILGGEV